jgi:hypothetical protein
MVEELEAHPIGECPSVLLPRPDEENGSGGLVAERDMLAGQAM